MAREFDPYVEDDFRTLDASDIEREAGPDAPLLLRYHDGERHRWFEFAEDDGGEDERKGAYVIDFDPPGLVDGHSVHVAVVIEHGPTGQTRVFHGSSSLGVETARRDAFQVARAWWREGRLIAISTHACRIGQAI